MKQRLEGLRVTVMGLGRFGGGVGVTRWLAGNGAKVLVTDHAAPGKLTASLKKLRGLLETGAVEVRLGGHVVDDFQGCDLVVANPAVPRPWVNPYLAAAVAAGVPITTEIALLVERLDRGRVIGVTGTAGKSTTASMIHHILKRTGAPRLGAHLGGNIGGSLLEELPAIAPGDLVVLELSSAMLYWLGAHQAGRGKPWSPHVAVLTNLTPNHLDWHGSLAHYRRCKQSIFAHQQPGDHAVSGAEAPTSAAPITLAVPGAHNQENAQRAVAAVCAATGLGAAEAAAALGDFPGLPHRLQLVAEHGGRRFFDDSKSTTPPSTCLAVAAFQDPRRVHLIAGGYDKGVDLIEVANLADSLAGLYAIGATGEQLAGAASGRGYVQSCRTLGRAARRAIGRMHPGDVCLLSPGCASWDQFDNYEERGKAFRRIVSEVVSG